VKTFHATMCIVFSLFWLGNVVWLSEIKGIWAKILIAAVGLFCGYVVGRNMGQLKAIAMREEASR
jgi:hydrogenase/urease accessory protein HupE